MNKLPLKPSVPFIWPEARVLEGLCSYQYPVQFNELAMEAEGLFGIVSSINQQGVDWIRQLAESSRNLKIRMVLALYGACGTKSEHLEHLLYIQQINPLRIEFAILTTEISYTRGTPTNLLCSLGDAGHFVQIGPTANFGLCSIAETQINLVFKADSSLMNELRKWFDYLWLQSAPLSVNTTKIPLLAPAKGTEDADEMWRQYLQECELAKKNTAGPKVQITVDPESGEVTATDMNGRPVEAPTEFLDLKPLDAVSERAANLYQQGSVVTIDKATRIPPLEAPIKAEWFGMESFQQIGTVSRQTQYKISLFDEKVMKDIENKRKTLRSLINAFSFPLSDSVAWMPAKARPLFEKHVQEASDEGKVILSRSIGGDLNKFVDDRMNKIVEDANKMYLEVKGAGKLSKDAIHAIVADLRNRLEKATQGNFLPQVSYMTISFEAGLETNVNSPWGQVLSLLERIARFPREIYSDPFKMRGLKIKQHEYADAMNVLDDVLLWGLPEKEPSQNVCRNQLAQIDEIMKLDELKHQQKCQLLLAIIDGLPADKFNDLLAGFVAEAHDFKLAPASNVNGSSQPELPIPGI